MIVNKPLQINTILRSVLRWIWKSILNFNKKSCCKSVLIFPAAIIVSQVFGQQRMEMQMLLDSALLKSPLMKEADANIQTQKHLVRAAVNLPSPEILIQNPTGHFYTIGVQQIVDFPTVYATQRKLQKEHVTLAERSKMVTAADLKYQISILFLELQYQHQALDLLRKQDSFYSAVSVNAKRSFQAGTLDYIESSYAELQANQLKTTLLISEGNYHGLLQNLKTLTGIRGDFIPDSMQLLADPRISALDTGIETNANVSLAQTQVAVNERKLKLEKQKVLPGFTMAYLNQGEKNTIFQNRFYAGIRIPLWFWQYKGNIDAARSQIGAAQYALDATKQKLSLEMQNAYNRYLTLGNAIAYYQTSILPQAVTLKDAAARFFAAGNTSYIDYLRNLNDAAEIQRSYMETLKNFNETIIYIQYLTGSL